MHNINPCAKLFITFMCMSIFARVFANVGCVNCYFCNMIVDPDPAGLSPGLFDSMVSHLAMRGRKVKQVK